MRARDVCLATGLFAALCACAPAPGDEALKADLTAIIEAHYAPGLLEVAAARRAGAFPFVLAGEQAEVAYDAELRLTRDHRFGAWDQINIAALALLLDAAPDGIDGVKPAGNVAGDLIKVRGRLSYGTADGVLKPAMMSPGGSPADPQGSVPLSDLADAARRAWQQGKETARSLAPARMLDTRRRDRAAAAARGARENGGYAVASGPEGSVPWQLARAAERAAASQGIAFAALAVAGPEEAVAALRDGRASAAIMRNTEAGLMAAAPEAGGGHPLALAALYPEPVHVVVKADSPLGSPAELFGTHVGVAGTSRAAAAEAESVLRAHGVPLGALASPLAAVPPAEALDQLAAGAFDALIMTAPAPSAALHAFGTRRPVRLLPFDGDAIAFLTSGIATYVAVTIPARTYPGQSRPLAAVAAVSMLVSMDTVPAKEAAGLLALMLTRVDYLRLGSAVGSLVSRDEARRPMALPWHPGAAAFFEITAQ